MWVPQPLRNQTARLNGAPLLLPSLLLRLPGWIFRRRKRVGSTYFGRRWRHLAGDPYSGLRVDGTIFEFAGLYGTPS